MQSLSIFSGFLTIENLKVSKKSFQDSRLATPFVLSSQYLTSSASRQSTLLSRRLMTHSLFSNPLSAMLNNEYLQAGQLFILNTMWVQGMGITLLMFLGFCFTLLVPMGMCMLAAYFYSIYNGPRVASGLTDSGFNELPSYPLIDLEFRPFLRAPMYVFLGRVILHVSQMPQFLLWLKVCKLSFSEWTATQKASELDVQASEPQIFLLTYSGLFLLMYSDAMMILICLHNHSPYWPMNGKRFGSQTPGLYRNIPYVDPSGISGAFSFLGT